MADVFLSYAHSDKARATQVADALEELGVSVWSGSQLAFGESWDDTIALQLRDARAVMVLWSERSVKSEWVRAEASFGSNRQVLVPLRIEPVLIPMPWGVYQTADLTQWTGQPDHPEWQKILARLEQLLERTGLSRRARLSTADAPGAPIQTAPGAKYVAPENSNQISVFVAHATADKPRLRPFVELLVDVGFSVWIDKPYELETTDQYLAKLSANRIHYGADWRESIRKAVMRCKRVLAFWSRDAIEGRREQFHYEVYQGLVQAKLRQCRLDRVDYTQIGFPYTFHHIADLSIVLGKAYHPAFQDLIDDIANDGDLV